MWQRAHLEKLLFRQFWQLQWTPRVSSITKPAIFPRQLAQNFPGPRVDFTFKLDDILILIIIKNIINIIIGNILCSLHLLSSNCACCITMYERSENERKEEKFTYLILLKIKGNHTRTLPSFSHCYVFTYALLLMLTGCKCYHLLYLCLVLDL